MCSPLWTMWGKSRTMHPKGLCAVHGWLLFIWTMTMWLLYCRLWFALYFMCDQIGRPIYISMGLYLYSLIKKYIKVASTVIYPWRCGVTASHWHSDHPNAYDSMSGILNQGQCLRFHLLVLSNHSKCHENEQSSDIEAHKWKVEHDTTTVRNNPSNMMIMNEDN